MIKVCLSHNCGSVLTRVKHNFIFPDKACMKCCTTKYMLGMKPGDVQYTALPLYHSFSSMFGIAGGLIAGGTLSVTPKFSASNFWKECYECNAKYIHYIGEMMRYVLETPPGPYDKKHNVQVKLKKYIMLSDSIRYTISFFQPKWILKMRVISITRVRIPLMLYK
jgi:acyl-CoA synthetase (AMP-forming)/AMP-acid ligase II